MYHIVAGLISLTGCFGSVMTIVSEYLRWKSYGKFSIATKVPVQIFGLKGPLVLIALCLYLIVTVLLVTETSTLTTFYLISIWSVLYFDIGLKFYNTLKEAMTHMIDVLVHCTNFLLFLYTLIKLSFIPVSFLIFGSLFWGLAVLNRLNHRKQLQDNSEGRNSYHLVA